MEQPYVSVTPQFERSPKDEVNILQKFLHIHVYTTLSTTPRKQNQLRCPSAAEWIKKSWYIYMIESFSAIRTDVITIFSRKYTEMKIIMLGVVSQTQNQI